MASLDLVPAGDDLPEADSDEAVARIEARAGELPELIEAGDTATLRRWREEGQAAKILMQKRGYEKEARAIGRQTLRCAAALGVIANRELPQGHTSGGDPLGVAMERGRLEQVLDSCGGSTDEHMAARRCALLGTSRVSRSKVAGRIRKLAAERQVSITQLAASHDIWPSKLMNLTSSKAANRLPSVKWLTAQRTAQSLGLDLSDLPPFPSPRKRSRPRAKWLTHKPALGGGRWDEVGVRLIRMRDEMTRVSADWVDNPLLYEAMRTVSEHIQREIHNPANQEEKP